MTKSMVLYFSKLTADIPPSILKSLKNTSWLNRARDWWTILVWPIAIGNSEEAQKFQCSLCFNPL